jgi:sugar fermentation stimulation protein A
MYRFPESLKEGVVLSRPNRFIMLVRAEDRTLRCHCPVTGRIGDIKLTGIPCLYSTASDVGRKTAHTVEAISVAPEGKRSWVGINQTAVNRYFEFFLRNGELSDMAKGYLKREVRLGNSRIDFLVANAYIEVKTPLIMLPAAEEVQRVAHSKFDSFDRLIRHMAELQRSLAPGRRAVIAWCHLYDAKPFRPPARDKTLSRILSAARRAEKAGVENWQVNMRVDREGVALIRYFRSKHFT